jgi:hypothetical protein
MKNIQILGIILYILGILVALISAVKQPNIYTGLPDTLHIYIFSILIAIIGILLYNKNNHNPKNNSLEIEYHGSIILLSKAINQLKELNKNFYNLTDKEIIICIDIILDNCISPLTSNKIELSNIAYAERLLHRMWSATNDNYLDEAYNVCSEITEILNDTLIHIKEK